MGSMNNFTSSGRADVAIAVANTNTTAALSVLGQTSACIYNSGSTIAFLEFGGSSVTATANSDLYAAPGAIFITDIPIDATTVAAINPGGIGTIYIMLGSGV